MTSQVPEEQKELGINTGKPRGQNFSLQGSGSAMCWNKDWSETLKGLKTLKLHKSASRGGQSHKQHSNVPSPNLPACFPLLKQQESAVGLQDILNTYPPVA